MKNYYFPNLDTETVSDINSVCEQHNFRFVYNTKTRMSYLLDSAKNIHGNISLLGGYVVIKIGHVLVSLFRYIKLYTRLTPLLNFKTISI